MMQPTEQPHVVFNDKYLNVVADIYMTLNHRHNLIGRGVTFEYFLQDPDKHIRIINQIEDTYADLNVDVLKIRELPISGRQFDDVNISLTSSLLLTRHNAQCR